MRLRRGPLVACTVLFLVCRAATAGDVLPEWWENDAADRATPHASEGPKLEEHPLTQRPSDAEIVDQYHRQAPAAAGSRYVMQPGDLLQISVWHETDMDREVQVSPDGWFAFPLIGEVPAAGLSVEEVRVEVARRLSQFIPKAVVTVSLKEMRGNKIYVLGKVNRPGAYAFYDAIDVVQALSLAGGAGRFAELDNIRVIRRLGDKQTSIAFNYTQVQHGEKLEQNIQLKSGDVVMVP